MSSAVNQAMVQSSIKEVPFSFQAPPDTWPAKPGPCDMSGKADKNQLVEYRMSTVLFQWAVAANNGVLAANFGLQAFLEGVGDISSPTGSGWGTAVNQFKLTEVQTNLLPKGSLNNAKGGAFVATSVGIQIHQSFAWDSAVLGARTYSAGSQQYSLPAARALGEGLTLNLRNRDSDTTRQLTLPANWPMASSMYNDAQANVGVPNGGSVILPLRTPWLFLDDNNGNQSQLNAIATSQITLLGTVPEPVPTGFSTPVSFYLIGGPIADYEACAAVVGQNGDALAVLNGLMAKGMTMQQAMDFVRAVAK